MNIVVAMPSFGTEQVPRPEVRRSSSALCTSHGASGAIQDQQARHRPVEPVSSPGAPLNAPDRLPPQLCCPWYRCGDHSRAQSQAGREALLGLELDEASGDGLRLYLSQWSFPNVLTALGRHVEAIAEFDKAAKGASNLGHAITYARVLTDQGAALVASGKSMNAITLLSTALMALKRHEAGSDGWLGDICRNTALAWRAAGELTKADECFHQAIGRCRLARRHNAADEVEREWRQQQ